jgi:hypothetical protein
MHAVGSRGRGIFHHVFPLSTGLIMKFCFAVIVFSAAIFASPLFAKDNVQPAINASSKDAFATVSTWVRKQMDEGGRYAQVKADERSRVNARLDDMDRLFQKRGDVAQMNDTEKLEMFNNQQEVNAILAKRDNDRLICKYEAPIGSHIPVKTCRTAGEIEERRRQDSDFVRQHRSQQLQGGN